MAIPRTATHIQAQPRNGSVEFHIDIGDQAAITADADLEEAQELIDTLEGNDGQDADDEALIIDEG